MNPRTQFAAAKLAAAFVVACWGGPAAYRWWFGPPKP
jgi:hypothetical protein